MPTLLRDRYMSAIFLNGRFHGQNLAGVQRFAQEITRALDSLWAREGRHRPIMLMPRNSVTLPAYNAVTARQVGMLSGDAWEQTELPLAARGGLLVSFGNAAPVAQSRQLVVIHDAGVFMTPASYSRRFVLWYRWLHRRLARGGARIVTVSRSARTDIARCLGMSEGRIAVVEEGGGHLLRQNPNSAILDRHGLRRGRFVLVVGGRATNKNLAVLSLAAERLRARGQALVLTGGLAPSVFNASANSAPISAIQVGQVDDASLRALYEAATCLVLPSRYEGFGLPALEAMACGCPVVAAHAGSLPEICAGAVRLFDPADPHAAYTAIAEVLDTRSIAEELRARGRQRASVLTWERAAETMAALVAEQGT